MATTLFLHSLPSTEAGLLVPSGNTAWGFGPWKIIDSSVQYDMWIRGISFQPVNIPTVDSVSEILFEIGKNNPEVTILQYPYSIKADTNANYYLNKEEQWLPEPIFVAAGTMLSVRVARDSPTSSTYSAFKLRVQAEKDISASTATPTVTFPENYKRMKSTNGIMSSIGGM
jgi:hypothetical protein